MLKSTSRSSSGTSFHYSTVRASVDELIKIIGEPTYESNDGEDKVNIEWELEDDNGDVVTVYDWKEYRPLSYYEQIEWHIGGMSKNITDNAKEEIEYMLTFPSEY
jgi:hypothetical protein